MRSAIKDTIAALYLGGTFSGGGIQVGGTGATPVDAEGAAMSDGA